MRVRHFVVAPGKGRFCLRYFNHVESKHDKVDQTICTESALHSNSAGIAQMCTCDAECVGACVANDAMAGGIRQASPRQLERNVATFPFCGRFAVCLARSSVHPSVRACV